MERITKSQLEVLSKAYENSKGITMNDILEDGRNLKVPGFEKEVRELFQNKLLEINGASYVLTQFGRKIYEDSSTTY